MRLSKMSMVLFAGLISHIGLAHANCSDTSLQGGYTFTVHGQSLSPDGTTSTGLIDGVGYITFDGNGNANQEDFVVKSGSEVPGGEQNASGFHTGETGTYTINDDCTGTLNITLSPGNTRTDQIVISKRGAAIHAIVSAATANGAPILLQVYADFESVSAR
jgi:hypothetical protein